MNDERFEVSADMRLIALQREALGVERAAPAWTSRAGLDLPHGSAEEKPREQTGTILVASIDARPKSGLIPGALVTVSVVLANDGDTAAAGVRIALPQPLATTYRLGTLTVDGVPVADRFAGDLLGDGLSLAPVAKHERRTITFALIVEAGVEPIVLLPSVTVERGAVLGPRGIQLTRGAAPNLAAPPERPFYESEPDEDAVDAVAEDLQHTALIPAHVTPRPEPPARGSEAVSHVPPAPAALSVRGADGPVLTTTIDRGRLGSLSALFAGRSLGMIAHYIVLNAFVVTHPLPDEGPDTGELRAFVATQEQLLSRALILIRLGKRPQGDSLAAPLPPAPSALRTRTGAVELPPAPEGSLLLVRAIKESEVAAFAKIAADAQGAPFLRASQFFVGLCASDVAISDDGVRRRIGTLLASYGALASAEINRIYLRAKVTRTPDLFKETEPRFDQTAKDLIVALEALHT